MENQPVTSQPALLILADDLTGANDVGAQFAKRGIRSVVLVEPDVPDLPRDYEVIVVNTESRHVPAAVAADRVRRITELGLRAGAQHFFKKTDSTLRGNIGPELKALMETLGEQTIPFVPAFPETGRTTRRGIHFVHGIPIAETEFARDPLSPVSSSSVAEVLNARSDLPVTSVSLQPEFKIGGTSPAATRLVHSVVQTFASPTLSGLPSGCVVFDCESREEMTAIARAFALEKQLRILAGSAAFAEELPHVLPLRIKPLVPVNARGPILLVNGSLNPRSLQQISFADASFRRIRLETKVLLELDTDGALFEQLRSENGRNVLLYSAENSNDTSELIHSAANLGLQSAEAHLRVATVTGRIVDKALRQLPFGTLVVFGGDTLLGIARACRWKAFIPRTEIAPGITVSTPQNTDLTVINKAGGFGEPNVVQTIHSAIADHL